MSAARQAVREDMLNRYYDGTTTVKATKEAAAVLEALALDRIAELMELMAIDLRKLTIPGLAR